jgi:hypothetical protein
VKLALAEICTLQAGAFCAKLMDATLLSLLSVWPPLAALTSVLMPSIRTSVPHAFMAAPLAVALLDAPMSIHSLMALPASHVGVPAAGALNKLRLALNARISFDSP